MPQREQTIEVGALSAPSGRGLDLIEVHGRFRVFPQDDEPVDAPLAVFGGEQHRHFHPIATHLHAKIGGENPGSDSWAYTNPRKAYSICVLPKRRRFLCPRRHHIFEAGLFRDVGCF